MRRSAQETSSRHRCAAPVPVGTNFKAWLLKIALNNSACNCETRRAPVWLQAWASLHSLTSHSTKPKRKSSDEARGELWNLVDRLDEKYRTVVVLRLVHDLTVAEIGQVLELTEKTVYSRLYAAFARLRARLKDRPEFASLWDEGQP